MNILQSLHDAWAWAKLHPELVWPIVTMLVTALLKPRSPEQYSAIAKSWPRVAALLQLVGALGIDAPKALEALGKVRSGEDKPPKGPSVLPVALLAFAFAVSVTACKPSAVPRETARATVLVLADAVKQLDSVCAQLATSKHDVTLATKCADGYDVARAALLGAESSVDAYDSGAAKDLPCAVARAADAVQHIAEALSAAGAKVPPAVTDALKLAPSLAGACHG
jgi:hypothetical protein